MKTNIPIPVFAGILLALTGLALIPALQTISTFLIGGAAVVALALLLLNLKCGKGPAQEPPAAADSAKPAPIPQAASRAEAEVVSLLAALQEKGRLVDFLMDDITAYEDAQVGAAARVVHQGCSAVLKEHFEVKPVQDASEGSSVTVPKDHAADEYRLTGNLSGEAPFSGTLVHKGWKTTSVKLPRLIDVAADESRLPAIAPAEVEVR
ncbi:MAG: hypothetical protein ACI8UO_003571 [Verrucomicrobiales bacterium]|jgi:hypothetical protein